jgi:hypothetical protein
MYNVHMHEDGFKVSGDKAFVQFVIQSSCLHAQSVGIETLADYVATAEDIKTR